MTLIERILPHIDTFTSAMDLLLALSTETSFQRRNELRDLLRATATINRDSWGVANYYEFTRECYKSGAMDGNFDDYCIFLEWERDAEKRFYLPRREQLYPVTEALQRLWDGHTIFLGVSLPTRVGKLIADDTPILTFDGWSTHGELLIGDKVIAPDGKWVNVMALSVPDVANTAVHFSNGEVIKCHANHEWETNRGLVNTSELRIGDKLPRRSSIIGRHTERSVDPYTFGVWLGDGTNKAPIITGNLEDRAVVADLPYEMTRESGLDCVFGGLRNDLQEMGMCFSTKRTQKHIPDEYMVSDEEFRLELLAGLIDTDGHLEGNRYGFSNADEVLMADVVSLVSTFGWKTMVVNRKSKLGIWQELRFVPDRYIPCRLERKQKRDGYGMSREIYVTAITEIEPVSGRCIQVDGGMYCVGRTMIPTHNSTLCIFFLTMVMGMRPDVASVMSGHSDMLTDPFYREAWSIITDDTTYNWQEIFPNVDIVSNSARNETIDLGSLKRFPTLTCRSISGTLTGAVEIGTGGLLYCDDLVEDLEESLNPVRLAKKYDAYLNQLQDRKKMGTMELMVGTRWNVFDPLGIIEAKYRNDPRYEFLVIPAMDENDESNFDYKYGLGFDTQYFRDMRDKIDDATWWAKYMGQPYIREGLLFPKEKLKRFNGVLPGEPERVIACVDVAWGGGDNLSMPVLKLVNGEMFLCDAVYSKAQKTVTQPMVVNRIIEHKIQQVEFEANNGGDEYKETVNGLLKEKNYKCSLTDKRSPSNTSKLGRILQYTPEILRVYYLDDSVSSPEYKAFMQDLTTFSQSGKNPNDDAPDSMAMLMALLNARGGRVEVFNRPF